MDEGFTVWGALLPNGGQWLKEKDWLYLRDLAFCNELHINNFIILLSAEPKRNGRQAKSNLFPFAKNSGVPFRLTTEVMPTETCCPFILGRYHQSWRHRLQPYSEAEGK